MKRAAGLAGVLVLAFAQGSRDAYRSAYREWRQADPGLERDAGSANDLAARASRMAQEQSKFASVQGAFVTAMAADEARKLAWLATPPDAPSAMTSEGAAPVIANENRIAKRNIDALADDPDPGIQELRGMLARESTAADGLSAAMENRNRVAEELRAANTAVAESQLRALDQFHGIEPEGKHAVEESNREAAAWSQYYSLLENPAIAVAAPATLPAPNAPVAPRNSIAPVPLVRYTGEWTFPVMGAFHGPRPEAVDLVVHEHNGHADGTFSARYQLPPGSTDDPALRFDFSGEIENTRNQQFRLVTSDGAVGTIELIPGPAFNLLEINFQTDPKSGKIRQGNMLLVKK